MGKSTETAELKQQIAKLLAEAKQLECEAEQRSAAAAAKYAEISELVSPTCATESAARSVLPLRGLTVKRNLRHAKTGVKTRAWQRAWRPVRRAA